MTKSFAQASRSRVLKMRPMPTTEDTQSANERKKLIAAILLGTLAMFMIARTFILSPTPNKGRSSARRTSNTAARAAQTAPASPSEVREDPLVPPQPIRYSWPEPTGVAIGRNIFAYYIPPATNRASASQPPLANTPTPTPPPPLILASLSPPSVHARTGEFTLEAFGDKFTPQTRIVFGNNELPTRFISGQQLAATVPAALVVGEGPRQVIVRTPDGKLFSNTLVLNVIPPPTPPFNYIGLIGGQTIQRHSRASTPREPRSAQSSTRRHRRRALSRHRHLGARRRIDRHAARRQAPASLRRDARQHRRSDASASFRKLPPPCSAAGTSASTTTASKQRR